MLLYFHAKKAMTSILIPSLSISLLFIFFFSASLADVVPSNQPLTPETVCNATMDPTYCKTVLTHSGKRPIYDYCKASINQSLHTSRVFSALINKFLKRRASLPSSIVNALEDCRLLADLNMDFLITSSSIINSSRTLHDMQTDDLDTMLSSILTNQQTCSDGIVTAAAGWTAREGLLAPLTNGSKLYSVALAIFTLGWEDRDPEEEEELRSRRRLMFSKTDVGRHGQLPSRMSNSASGRKLLQASESVTVLDAVVVNPDGSGNFTTITDAIAAAPNNTAVDDGYFVIFVVAGEYEENVVIDKKKKHIMMIGDGIDKTVITGNRSVVDGWTTFNSATLAVVGQGFVAVNITVRNTAGAIKHQAVAVRNGADLSTFYSCSFEGYQDTLYTHSNRQFYRECDVYGTIDFIFGNGAVVLQDCNIIARLPLPNQFNAITAQGRTDPNQNTGISIQNCNIIAAPELAADGGGTKTYLGRPWKEFSRTVYLHSNMDSLIDPAGWREWNGEFALNTLYYAEYENTGPGSDIDNRVTWPGYGLIDAINASSFTVSKFVFGDVWLPATGVPYDSDL